jgi:dTDP-4-amino-4,6-dideoxygalactose transaminase
MRIGMNGRLDTMQAAVLLAKLTVFDSEIARREEIATLYDAGLADVLEVPARVPGGTAVWAVYGVLLPHRAARDTAQAALQAAGIATAIYYPRPLHRQPAYAVCHDGAALPVSEGLGERILALPIHPDLTDAQAARVVDTLRGASRCRAAICSQRLDLSRRDICRSLTAM